MTSSLSRTALPGGDAVPPPVDDRPRALLDLASGWLRSEAASVREPGNAELVSVAVERALLYEEALAAATPDVVRLAWEQAVVRQAQNDVGSVPWATASRVAELLRYEDKAARLSQAVTGQQPRLGAADVAVVTVR